ncbi:Unknown protein [Striga hermonthica]|uniref:Uncharacterized protein n=1 Tax=Striga hermonthica TaxID=68872 RepID=A0A9N7NCC6_STRHE|nr:Unknown protein [Striga hermonthica]
MQFARWKDIPTQNKKILWLAMKQKFNLEEDIGVKKIVFEQLNRQYQSLRHNLHEHYENNLDDENILEHPPKGITPENWAAVINYFETEDFKKVSERNKQNRRKLKLSHACGTKSIAQYCYEECDIETGKEPTRTSTWKKTRFSNNKNDWVDDASREVYEEILKFQNGGDEDIEDVVSEDEAFIKVLGPEKSSRLRGCGDGLKPPSKRGENVNQELAEENE